MNKGKLLHRFPGSDIPFWKFFLRFRWCIPVLGGIGIAFDYLIESGLVAGAYIGLGFSVSWLAFCIFQFRFEKGHKADVYQYGIFFPKLGFYSWEQIDNVKQHEYEDMGPTHHYLPRYKITFSDGKFNVFFQNLDCYIPLYGSLYKFKVKGSEKNLLLYDIDSQGCKINLGAWFTSVYNPKLGKVLSEKGRPNNKNTKQKY